MNDNNKSDNTLDETKFDETAINSLTGESRKEKFQKWSMVFRVAGFVLLFCSLVLLYFWKEGASIPVIKYVAYTTASIGLIVYLTGRILAFLKPKN